MDNETLLNEPNMVGEAYRNYSQVPVIKLINKHLDFIEITSDGFMLLGTSNLTGRIWSGTIWMFANPSDAPEVGKSLAAFDFESGITDGKFLKDSKIMVGEDTGSLQILSFVQVADGKTFYLSTKGITCEHDEGISCLDVFHDKTKGISGGMDKSIKIWNTEVLCCNMTFSPAHCHVVTSVSVQPGSNNVFLSTSLDGTALLWDIREDRPACLLNDNKVGFTASSWVGDNTVALGSLCGHLSLMDTRMKSEIDYSECYTRPVHKLKYCQKNDILMACGDNTVVKGYNCSKNSLSKVYECDRHSDFIRGLAIDEKSRNFYSCGWDGRVLNHDVSSVTNSNFME